MIPMLLCDFYKISHREMYPKGTEKVYSTWTCRGSRVEGVNETVFFGLQKFVVEYLIEYFDKNFFSEDIELIKRQYKRFIKHTLGEENPQTEHIEALHKVGYLPLKICAVPEGTLVPTRVPCMTIENTMPEFFWVTNFVETLMSAELWQPITSATTAYQYKKIVDKYADETVGNRDHVPFQCHDFSFRGMQGLGSAVNSGMGHLLSFSGTDTIPAIIGMEDYYKADITKELVGSSIPATEHSIMCSYGNENELDLFKHLITEVHPKGLVSIVSDTWDFWKVMTEYLPQLKDLIMSRDGKVVIRPDSGIPEDIICGTADIICLDGCVEEVSEIKHFAKDDAWNYFYETEENEVTLYYEYKGKIYKAECEAEYTSERGSYSSNKYYVIDEVLVSVEEWELTAEEKGAIQVLWETFGGTVNALGYRELDPHIGLIYGDSITVARCEEICRRLKNKGFASNNIVLGVGSFSYTYVTRDTFAQALKATYAVVDGEERFLFKNPKTDDGTKKSQKGMVFVAETPYGIAYRDGLNAKDLENLSTMESNLLEPVFENGKLVRSHSLAEIRNRLNK